MDDEIPIHADAPSLADHVPTAPKTPRRASETFELAPAFVEGYASRHVDFGLQGLGLLVYARTYARVKDDGSNESFYETVARVVNGTYGIRKRWMLANGLQWDEARMQAESQRMYDKMFHLKFLPSGRGLFAMGSPLTQTRDLNMALNSCAFVSSSQMWSREIGNPAKPFAFMADCLMCGVGVGFDVEGAKHTTSGSDTLGSIVLGPDRRQRPLWVDIEDTRQGWVKSVEDLINSYLHPNRRQPLMFNYDKIRPEGTPIKGFGGVSSGPEPLRKLHKQIRAILDSNTGRDLTVTSIADLFNCIGACVVSGNVRRSAQIALGSETKEFIGLKDFAAHPERSGWAWASNNSIKAQLGQNYEAIADGIKKNGEPGLLWLENARAYGRMGNAADYKDSKVIGTNPCAEQSLENYELCNLVEVFINRHETLEDFLDTLQIAFTYGKTVTLTRTHIPETNRVLLRNRRIGTSLSGIAQFIETRGIHTLRTWLSAGYAEIQRTDERISNIFCIPRSIKTTTVKPSGTISLLAGATPGVHYPENRHCIRRVRIAKNSKLLPLLRLAGYPMEDSVTDAHTIVVSFYIDYGPVRPIHQVSMWEQLEVAAMLQELWSDNAVSVTISFDPKTEGDQIEKALEIFQYKLKSVSFLPREVHGYLQIPIERIEKEDYEKLMKDVNPALLQELLNSGGSGEDGEEEQFCTKDTCITK